MARFCKATLPFVCKDLWENIFHDSEEFTKLYFSRRFSTRRTFYMTRNGTLLSAMQSIPYNMTFFGEKISVGYVSGLLTRPEEQGKGYATQVLEKSHRALYKRGAILSLLIPATPELYNYYERRNYIKCFFSSKETISPSSDQSLEPETLTPEISDFVQHELLKRSFSIQHTLSDLKDIDETARMSNGGFYVLRKGKIVVAVAIVERFPSFLIAKDAFGNMTDIKTLLSKIKQNGLPLIWNNFEQLQGGNPYGMARIINMEKLMKTYAAHFPNSKFQICIPRDETIPENIGTYTVDKGKCVHFKEITSKLPLRISTEIFLQNLKPVMSIMLD